MTYERLYVTLAYNKRGESYLIVSKKNIETGKYEKVGLADRVRQFKKQ